MQQRIFNALPCLSIIKFLNSLSDKRKGDAAPPVIFVCKMTFVHYAEMFCEYLWNKQITISETFVRYVWNISGTFEPHVDFYIYLMFTSFFYIHVMATSFFYIYVMATNFFHIYVMATSFFYIYVMATSFFYTYVMATNFFYIYIYIHIYITFTNWRSVQSFYWTLFLFWRHWCFPPPCWIITQVAS